MLMIFVFLVHGCAAISGFRQIPFNTPLTRLSNETSALVSRICGISSADKVNATSGRLYPWAVSFTTLGRNSQGGVVISPLHVLTAAHPFLMFDKSKIGACSVNGYKSYTKIALKRVNVGDDCIRSRRAESSENSDVQCHERHLQIRKIRAVAVDERFAEGLCVNGSDWAIVELDRPLYFDNNIAPICLPSKNITIQSDLMAVSWGRPKLHLRSQPLLRETPLKYDENCKVMGKDIMPTRVYDYLCARSLEPFNEQTKRICHGDSGSGLQQDMALNKQAVLVGLTSFGSETCEPDELVRFTQITHHVDAICQLTGLCYMN